MPVSVATFATDVLVDAWPVRGVTPRSAVSAVAARDGICKVVCETVPARQTCVIVAFKTPKTPTLGLVPQEEPRHFSCKDANRKACRKGGVILLRPVKPRAEVDEPGHVYGPHEAAIRLKNVRVVWCGVAHADRILPLRDNLTVLMYWVVLERCQLKRAVIPAGALPLIGIAPRLCEGRQVGIPSRPIRRRGGRALHAHCARLNSVCIFQSLELSFSIFSGSQN